MSQAEREAAVEHFHKITQAYSTLSDTKKKLDYDSLLNGQTWTWLHVRCSIVTLPACICPAKLVTQKWPVSDVVDLDDMTFESSTGRYWFPCRCGGQYEVGEEELGEGVGLVCCSTCSLSIRITYQEEEEEEDL